jgi:hypothetical protein
MNKETCKEYFDKLPFTSDHIFATDGTVHNNPINCIKCGKSAHQWEEEILEKAKDMPEIEELIKQTQIQFNKLSDFKPQ